MPGLIKKEEFKDNCGFGLIANINGVKSHKVIINSINALISMTHRGGVGSDGKTGDGCGLLFDIDHKFFADTVLKEQNIEIGEYFAIGQIFYHQDISKLLPKIKKIIKSENLVLAAYRKVPVDEKILGEIAHSCMPEIFQLFIRPTEKDFNQDVFETGLIQARKYIEEIYMDDNKLYVCSMSSKTVVYKGLMLPNAIKEFYLDLNQESFRASTCVFHQRFSTNTSPRWHLAQPFRLLAHNGEINAIRGNRNWVKARSSKFKTPLIPKIQKFKQLVNETGSDSSSLDNMIELLVKGGVDIFRAIRMVLPPAWQNIQTLDPDVRGFHEYNSMHMEPWDGPAGIVMADGKWALCVLDRNGLRPARFQLDKDNIITIASETGVYPVNESDIVQKGRVAPGGMLAIDTSKGKIYDEYSIDEDLKQKYPYRKWLKENAIYIESSLDSYEGPGLKKFEASKFLQSSKLFLLFKEERTSVIKPLAIDSQEGTGSMGDDTALAVMSKMHRQLYDFFRQQFAQVTNPPIDSLREAAVMTLETCYGPELNIYEETPEHAKRLVTTSPVLSYRKLNSITKNAYFKSTEINLVFDEDTNLKSAIKKLQKDVEKAVKSGSSIIHLIEDLPEEGFLPINALLAVGAVHQHLDFAAFSIFMFGRSIINARRIGKHNIEKC